MTSSLFIPSPLARAVGAACAAAALLGAPVQAQEAMPAATGASTAFAIRGFELKGDIPLSADETTRILAPFIRTDGTLETLQQAATALEAALRARGFALHRVSLPPQEVGDKVRFDVVKFVIGKVTIEQSGSASVSDFNVRNSLPELREGEAPNFQTLAVQTAIAKESPSKQVQVSLKESEEPEKIDVKLQVKADSPLSLTASASNTGSDATGNDRVALVGGYSNVFDSDQQFSFAYTSSVERTDNVKQVGLNYRIPLYAQSAVLAMSYTTSDVVGNFGSFNSAGAGETYGLNYSMYLPPDGGRRSYFSVALDEKQFFVARVSTPLGQSISTDQAPRGSRPLTLGYTAKVKTDSSVWGYNADVAVNRPGSNGNDLVSYQTEDARIQTVDWNAIHIGANYLGALPAGWLMGLRGQAQWSDYALISGEQFGLGGASSVRGTAERVLSGDSGAQLSLEMTTPELSRGLRLLGFVDGGWLSSNHTSATSTGKPASDQLASAGFGLRYSLGRLNLSADWGHVVTGANPPLNAGTQVPKAGDEKLHLNLSARF